MNKKIDFVAQTLAKGAGRKECLGYEFTKVQGQVNSLSLGLVKGVAGKVLNINRTQYYRNRPLLRENSGEKFSLLRKTRYDQLGILFP